MASTPITSWEIDGETMETVTDFISEGSNITADGDCSFEIKTLTPWKESYDQPRQHIKKRGHYFANKCPSSQSYGLIPVVMYGCESWTIKLHSSSCLTALLLCGASFTSFDFQSQSQFFRQSKQRYSAAYAKLLPDSRDCMQCSHLLRMCFLSLLILTFPSQFQWKCHFFLGAFSELLSA